MKHMKKYLALLLTLLLLFALASCGDSSDDNSSDSGSSTSEDSDTGDSGSSSDDGETKVIKIGHICDQTGTDALTGAEAAAAMEYAVEYVEEYFGYNGYTFEVIHGDAQSTSDGAGDAARQLIEQSGVDIVVGPTMIGEKAAAAAVCTDAEVPIVFYNPTPESFMETYTWLVGASGTTPQMPTVMADYIYNDLGYTKVYTLTKDDTGGTAYSEPFIANFEALGGTVVAEQYAPNDTADYAPYLVSMSGDEADALVAWTSGSAAIALWQAWYDAGLSETLPIVAFFSGAFTDSFICDALNASGRSDVVEAILGTYTPMSWAYDIETEENQQLVEAYTEDHDGTVPIGNNLVGATAQVIILIRAAVESLDASWDSSQELLDALLAQDITGPEGRTVFGNGSQAATKDIYVTKVIQLEDGTYNYGLVKLYSDVPPEGLTVD
ncbi:MAG: ABC transporter substrate-binding protein [Oscillospiraceae bacterium]|nr:ABC transporter substrate-binding protein [Oscillospiraceae bacterium]